MGELSLWLDSYNDIYSDFDNRNYARRRISEDFLYELRMELKSGEFHSSNLVLLLPREKRSEEQERLITSSLKELFTLRFYFHKDKCRKKINNIIKLFIGGMVVILLNSWISYNAKPTFFVAGLRVLLEPAGWFLIWSAFDFLFYDFPGLKKEREFYKKLSEMHIHFKSS